jgi:hypothetical protein
MQADFNLEKTVEVYLKIRNAIEELKERQKEELTNLEEQYEVVSNTLLEFCNEQNLDSVKTKAGTISRRVTSRYWTSDWDSLNRVILEHEAPYLLEKRIHNGNMKQFLEENPEAFPAGLQADSKYTVQVRKATK